MILISFENSQAGGVRKRVTSLKSGLLKFFSRLSKALRVLTVLLLYLSLLKDLVLKKIDADNQEIKMAEERIAKLSKTMQNSKEKTSKLLNQESFHSYTTLMTHDLS